MQKSTVKFEFLSENSIKVCAKGCCPIVSLDDNKIFIQDDYNGKIELSVEEALNISEAVRKLTK